MRVGLGPSSSSGVPPVSVMVLEREEVRWRHFDNSVNAVSFGFVATAILIFMFLVMAIFERFLSPRSTPTAGLGRRTHAVDLQSGGPSTVSAKGSYPSPKMSIYAKGVSVLMPGQDIPTFIAHPAPAPRPPERISWPPHQLSPVTHFTSSSS